MLARLWASLRGKQQIQESASWIVLSVFSEASLSLSLFFSRCADVVAVPLGTKLAGLGEAYKKTVQRVEEREGKREREVVRRRRQTWSAFRMLTIAMKGGARLECSGKHY